MQSIMQHNLTAIAGKHPIGYTLVLHCITSTRQNRKKKLQHKEWHTLQTTADLLIKSSVG